MLIDGGVNIAEEILCTFKHSNKYPANRMHKIQIVELITRRPKENT